MPNGKICYVEIPATNVDASAKFYADVFGWQSRARGDGHRAFDDTTGAVSGSWVTDRSPQRESTMLTYIMVDSIDDTLKKIVAGGGRVRKAKTSLGDGGGFATFADPAGNVLGLYQEPRRA